MGKCQWVFICLFVLFSNTSIEANEKYLSFKLAYSDLTFDEPEESDAADFDSGTTWIVSGSQNLRDLLGFDGLYIEGEYFKSLVAPSLQVTEVDFDNSIKAVADISYWGAGVYAAFLYAVTDKLLIKGRLGYAYTSMTAEVKVICSGDCPFENDLKAKINDTGSGVSFGASMSYVLANDVSMVVEYTKINTGYDDGDITTAHIGVGVSFLFNT